MYQVSIFNNGVETMVHYPSISPDDPHVVKLPLKEGLSVVDILSFQLYPNNEGYDKVFELTTKIKVKDVRDDSIRFTGRILSINEKMDNSGIMYKDISCEGALSYLNDTKLRGTTIYADTVRDFLSQILTIHNSKVEPARQIQVGNVDIPGNAFHTCDFKTTLAEIILALEVIGGNIRVREVNDVLYMDWLLSFSVNTVDVSLGVNMKDMVKSKDITSLGTRIIPIGANNLTIESVNNGLDYLEDPDAKAIYGVIEKTVEYRDIEDPTLLRTTCINDLSNYTQPSFVLTTNALDLSYKTGNKAYQFMLGTNIHLMNPMMGVDSSYSVVELNLDLLTPYNPDLTISKKPITLSNAINDLRNSSIQNNGVYNNVQIGSSFGIRASRSDRKAITTMNATDGIRIQTNRGSGLVDAFFVDTNGNIKINTYEEISEDLSNEINNTNGKIDAVDAVTKTLKTNLDLQSGKISAVVEQTIPGIKNDINNTNQQLGAINNQTIPEIKNDIDNANDQIGTINDETIPVIINDINNTNDKINTVDAYAKSLKASLDIQAGSINAIVEDTTTIKNEVNAQAGQIGAVSYQTSTLSGELNIQAGKLNAVTESPDGGASWELNTNKFIVAFNRAGSGYTEISLNGIVIYDGKFKIKKGSDTVFYVSTSGRCTADGGFRVDDGYSTTEIDASGISITNDNGYTGTIQAHDSQTALYVPDDLYIGSNLRVYEYADFWSGVDFEEALNVYGNGYFDLDLEIDDDLTVNDSLNVYGTKHCLQITDNYGTRAINAYETGECYFGDIGNGIIQNGECVVYIDDIFGECVNTDINYQVDIFEYEKRGSITDIVRYPNHFIVKGDVNNIEFGWEIKAKRKGYENDRLELVTDKNKVNTNKLENDLLTNDVSNNSNYLLDNKIINLEDVLLENNEINLEDMLLEEVV